MTKFIFLLFILNLSAWSADLHLFQDDQNYNDNFSQSIFSGDLQVGEKIFLRDRSVTYKGILGSGNTTLILKVYDNEIGRELALRLPHGNQEKNYNILDGKRFINYTYDGFNELNESKLPIPKIHSYEKSSYLLVDLIENDFNLKEFLTTIETIEDSQRKQIENSLISFAKKSFLYQSIGDFHLEQLVYSNSKSQWYLLDWSSGHSLARQASSQTIFNNHLFTDSKRNLTEYEKDLLDKLNEVISEERTRQAELDTIEFEKIKAQLVEINDHHKILETYKGIKDQHMMSFYTLLQKDFISNHLPKFPEGGLKLKELEVLLDKLGKFSPFYFSQFAEKVISNISDLNTFMYLFKKMNEIGLDEELEDDISNIIANNMQRILSNTTESEDVSKNIESLKSEFGLISYRTKDILENASEFLRPAQSCNESLAEILNL